MKVLILGAGYTGRRIAQWLIQHQVEVIVTNRSGIRIPELHCPVVQYKVSDDQDASNFLSGGGIDKLRGVTHILSTVAPTPKGLDPLLAGFSNGLNDVLNAASLDWVGYLSTTGVYGDTQGKWVTEESPVNPGTQRSQYRVEIEQQFLQIGLPSHIFRLPGIYGPGRSIFERIKAGRAQHIVKPGHVFSRVHVDDIVQAVWASMQMPMPGERYNVADDEPSEPRNLLLEASRLLGIEPPEAVALEAAQLSPMGRSFWQECRRVSNQKLKQTLGVTLYYPSYREGLRAIYAAQSASLS